MSTTTLWLIIITLYILGLISMGMWMANSRIKVMSWRAAIGMILWPYLIIGAILAAFFEWISQA